MKLYYTGVGTTSKTLFTTNEFMKLMNNVFIDSINTQKNELKELLKKRSLKRKAFPKTMSEEEYLDEQNKLKDSIIFYKDLIKTHEKNNVKFKKFTLQDWIEYTGADIVESTPRR